MATPNYKHQKKQREEAQRRKKDAKEQRKAEKKGIPLPSDIRRGAGAVS